LDEIGLVVYEEMSFKVKVYGRTNGRTSDRRRTDAGRKAITNLTLSLVTGELKNNIFFSCQFKGGNSDNFCARVKTLSHMMYLMTKNLCFKFEINTLRNKELIVKKS
jgi:hypothetical protein